ncbi:serine carboxypeptidase-like 18 [Gastrolobium bilobum]|uniref:serine carboxypeptidase-like 18 n=1 Tax=Gastrolobium bilobum TaxID=150636 RepID=UPI002AB2FD58|nr:serine carboxypeptidase-like 18 [Gastrolobium bilobum]
MGLGQWLASQPKFIANPVYIPGDSCSGKPLPIIATYISDGNEAGEKSKINIKGYVLGNPATDPKFNWNSRIPFAHRTALISDKLYKSVKMSCRGKYVRVKKDNQSCQKDLQAISQLTNNTNFEHILEPKCPYEAPISDYRNDDRSILQEKYKEMLLSSLQILQFGCRNYENLLLTVWANDVHVQQALHVRMGTVNAWIRCNRSIIYTNDVQSSVAYCCLANVYTKKYKSKIAIARN